MYVLSFFSSHILLLFNICSNIFFHILAGVPDHISQKEALEKNFRKGELKVTTFFEM